MIGRTLVDVGSTGAAQAPAAAANSGTWIGRHALAAAVRHHDGRPGGSAALAATVAVVSNPGSPIAAELDAADGHPKTAIVALLAGIDVATARQLLSSTDGRVRDAIARAGRGTS